MKTIFGCKEYIGFILILSMVLMFVYNTGFVYATQYSDNKVTGLKGKCTGSSTVSLNWDEYFESEFYELFRSDDNKSWKKIKNVYDISTFNADLSEGMTYYYKVRACISKEASEYSLYSDSIAITIETALDSPTNVSVKKAGINSVCITWNPVKAADYYILYRAENGNPWETIKTVYDIQTYNYNLVADNEYCYRVKACSLSGSEKITSNKCAVRNGFIFI